MTKTLKVLQTLVAKYVKLEEETPKENAVDRFKIQAKLELLLEIVSELQK